MIRLRLRFDLTLGRGEPSEPAEPAVEVELNSTTELEVDEEEPMRPSIGFR